MVKEWGRTNMAQSGLSETWWPDACTHFCAASNLAINNGDSSYNRRHKDGHCAAMKIPFGALVTYLPTEDSSRKPKAFAPKTRDGLFLGYHMHPGGKWSGDYVVVDFGNLRDDPDAEPGNCTK